MHCHFQDVLLTEVIRCAKRYIGMRRTLRSSGVAEQELWVLALPLQQVRFIQASLCACHFRATGHATACVADALQSPWSLLCIFILFWTAVLCGSGWWALDQALSQRHSSGLMQACVATSRNRLRGVLQPTGWRTRRKCVSQPRAHGQPVALHALKASVIMRWRACACADAQSTTNALWIGHESHEWTRGDTACRRSGWCQQTTITRWLN